VEVIAAHPCGLAALAKPDGLLSHPNRPGEEARSLVAAGYDEAARCFTWLDASGQPRRVWLLHRLDSATSGVVLVAAREEVARAVRAAFEQRAVRKRYLALVFGHPRARSALWRDAMDVERSEGRVRAADTGRLEAETAMRCLRLVPGPPAMAMIGLEPRTGRTHQLRHQCARRHLPIVGDQTYGDFKANREFARRAGTDRLFLHASSVAMKITVAGAVVKFSAEAPAPPEFAAWLARS
jgi:23S rRNA-/tRNA-specific pseudouridylate synthase